MAGSVNKVILVGNLGADPEIKSMPSGDRIANLRLATSESWKDRTTGERKEKTEWHRVVCFNDNLTKVIENYCKKGSTIYIEGSIQTRKWTDNAGVEKYSTEVVIGRFNGTLTLLGGKPTGDSAGATQNGQQTRESLQAAGIEVSRFTRPATQQSNDYGDEEIPF